MPRKKLNTDSEDTEVSYAFEPPSEDVEYEKGVDYALEKSPTATVKLLNSDVYDGCYLVYDVNRRADVFLVPVEQLQFSVSEQEIAYGILDSCVRPYSWEDEIRELIPSVTDVRLAILRNGFLRKTDIRNNSLAKDALYGAFPNRLPFKGEI